MKAPRSWIPAIVLALVLAPAALRAQPSPGTAFTYQGQLKEAGVPCEGAYDFIFQLWDAAEGGAMVSDDLYVDDRPVGAGLFTVQLDFGEGMFTGDERWLQVHVRPGDSSGSYTELSPRQAVTAAPYALYALSGPGSGGFWAASGDDIYNTNSGNVGIGTADPAYPLHVESDGTRIVYVRNNGVSGRALYASSNGTALYAEGGSCALDAYADSPTGIGISVFNEAESGNAYAVYANNISPTGVAIYGRTSNGNDYAGGIGVYGHAANDGYVTNGIGVYGRSESDHGGAGVYGEATATAGESAYGVHGVSTSNAGVRGENSDSGNYGLLGNSQYGVQGRGNSAGGYFEDASGSSYAYVGSGTVGVVSYGELAGGWFVDTNGSGYALVGVDETGVEAKGSEAGGHFEDTDHSGYAYVARWNHGIEAGGSNAGGYFEDSDNSGYAYVGWWDIGIDARGNALGGYFEDSDSSGFAYVGYGDRGIEAFGDYGGGYFEDTDQSGYAYVGVGDQGIRAYGDTAGGYFYDEDGSGWAYVGYDTCKIYGNGAVSFVQNHPVNPGEVVVYAAPEGDEVATYTRGTARLQNGVAHVQLGETFKWVTNPDVGLTAHLTLRGDCPGIFVKSLSTAEMVVQEVDGGTSDVAFDYLVYGLRIGFEEIAVVQEKTVEAYIPAMADHRALYERRPELREYNALERFKRMRAAVGDTEPLDLSTSQALHDAIVEFDLAVHSLDDGRELEAPEPIETGEHPPREQRPCRPELADPKDTGLAELRTRVAALEALVARLAAPQNGGEP
jgi:hypothetical protein